MSDIAPPFFGFIELSQIPETTRDVLLGKMLSGEHRTYVYSSEANGKLEPVHITPAEFFKAWARAQREAGCDEDDCVDANGWSLRRMDPYQIRVPDQDSRRSSAVRRRTGVPHWIYLLKADLAPNTTTGKSRAGRKAVYDWPEIRRFVFEQLTTRGDFDEPDQIDGWGAAADLYRAIGEKFGEKCPELTTLKERIPGFVAEWRASKGR